jgi:hypothetical protein
MEVGARRGAHFQLVSRGIQQSLPDLDRLRFGTGKSIVDSRFPICDCKAPINYLMTVRSFRSMAGLPLAMLSRTCRGCADGCRRRRRFFFRCGLGKFCIDPSGVCWGDTVIVFVRFRQIALSQQ